MQAPTHIGAATHDAGVGAGDVEQDGVEGGVAKNVMGRAKQPVEFADRDGIIGA